jgi:YabP family
MWWREQPLVWAMDMQSVRVGGVQSVRTVEPKRIVFVCTGRGLEILGDGLVVHSWDRSLAEVRGNIAMLNWLAPGANAREKI